MKVNKLRKITLISVIFLSVLPLNIYSQGEITLNKLTYKDKPYIEKIQKTKDDVFKRGAVFSVKGVYRNFSDPKALPSGLGFDFSAELGFGAGWFIGSNFDYWKKNFVTNYYGEGIYINKTYTGFGYNFFIKKKFQYKILNFILGIGAGNYTIYQKYPPELSQETSSDDYFNINFVLGTEVRIFKNLYLTGEVSLYSLIETLENGAGITNFRLGPTYYINLK